MEIAPLLLLSLFLLVFTVYNHSDLFNRNTRHSAVDNVLQKRRYWLSALPLASQLKVLAQIYTRCVGTALGSLTQCSLNRKQGKEAWLPIMPVHAKALWWCALEINMACSPFFSTEWYDTLYPITLLFCESEKIPLRLHRLQK